MASMTFFSPKSFLYKIADMFQKPEELAWNETQNNTKAFQEEIPNDTDYEEVKPKTKLNVSLSDLKLISTALLQYRRTLAKQGQQDKAEEVAKIDRQFYDLIADLELS